ncbi:MAG: hypothetical protein Q7O66_05895 [Dehalococcoidia bacterium]|nr:hypothetical protein [Dehalococcoidia bacterium]
MENEIALEELIAQNPDVDVEELARSLKLLQNLRANGISRRGYHLASPLTQRRATVSDTTSTASRVVHVARR